MMEKREEKALLLEAMKEAGLISDDAKLKNGVTLVGKSQGVRNIGFDEIRKTGWDIKANLSEWSNRDFALFIREKYSAKYSEDWGLNIIGVVSYMNQIKQVITEKLGFCDNVVFRDYINFYFDNWCDHFRKETFSLQPMRFDSPILDFIEKYDYKAQLEKYIKGQEEDIKSSRQTLTNDDIEKSYLLGEEAFLLSCGLIFSVNWLIRAKQTPREQAVDYVCQLLQNTSKSVLKSIIDITNTYSPYSSSFEFRDIQELLDKAGLLSLSDQFASINYDDSVINF